MFSFYYVSKIIQIHIFVAKKYKFHYEDAVFKQRLKIRHIVQRVEVLGSFACNAVPLNNHIFYLDGKSIFDCSVQHRNIHMDISVYKQHI